MLDHWTKFSKPGAYITHNANVSEITGGNLLDHSFLWSHKRLFTALFTYAVVLPKPCTHTVLC